MKSSSVGRSPTETYMLRQGSNDEGLEDDEAEMLRGGGAERVWVGLRGDANNREPLPLPVAHLIHLLGDRGANLANMSGTRWMLALMELILLIVAVVCILTYLITVPRSSTWVWSYFAGLRFSSTVAHIPFIIFQRSVLCSVLALTPSAMGLWLALQRTSSSTSLVRSSSTKSVVSYYLIISVLVIVFCGGVLMQNAVDQQHVEETLAPMLVNLWHNPSGVDGDDVAHLYRRRCAVQHQLQCVGLSICCQMNATSTWVVAEDGKSWSSTLEAHEEDGVHVCLIGVGDGRVMDRFTGDDVTSTVAAECPRCGDAPSSSSATTTTTQETNRVAAVVDRAGWVEDDGPPRCLDSMVGDLTRSYGFSICVVLIMMMLTSVATVLSYQIFAADSS